ncbi:MAG: hypothetical protein IPI64_11875 [Chloracidobacterium sp.]|nr:hypothetical protein [Chloracidobacterium sp.]
MKIRNSIFLALIALAFTFSTATQAQNRPYRVSDREVQNVLDRIEDKTNDLKDEVERNLDNSNVDGTNREDSINTMISNFENATDRLKDNFRSRRSTTNDVDDVLTQAIRVNSFMRNNRLSQNAQSLWAQIRADLNTIAGYYQTRANWIDTVNNNGGGWQNNQGGYTTTDAQIRTILDRIKQNNNRFRTSFNSWNRRYNRYNQNTTAGEVVDSTNELERALIDLRNNYNNLNRNSRGIDDVMRPAAEINTYIGSNRTNSDVMNKWVIVRNDLTTLAGYYRVSFDWNNPYNNNGNQGGQNMSFDTRLTGTYRLNSGMSDNVSTIVDRAIRNANYSSNEQDRMRRNLERRLASPETLTFEKNGRQVTMSSTNAASVVLNADGTKQTETSPNGRTVTTTVTATRSDLTINYEGDRMNDFYVSFMPITNNQLKVTRRLYLENQNTTVTSTSVYDKTSPTAIWNTTDPVNTGTTNGFIIPNNTNIVATLDGAVSTRTARDGDRFSMTVTSPSQYNGAVIEGNVVGERSGVVSGRANLTLSFNSIRLRNGQTYRFAGIVEQVEDTDGRLITVNNEGTVQDKSQTGTTVVRAGIGAVLGAIIGAIAGGGDGAAIGAGIGAGAGVGTVVLQGRDNLDLAAGSRFTITATAPANVSSR